MRQNDLPHDKFTWPILSTGVVLGALGALLLAMKFAIAPSLAIACVGIAISFVAVVVRQQYQRRLREVVRGLRGHEKARHLNN